MRGVDHIGVTVSDLDRSVAFYEMVLGNPPLSRGVATEQSVVEIVGYDPIELHTAYFAIPGASSMLELLEYREPEGARVDMETFNTGNTHVCFVVDDLAHEYARLAAAGVSFRHSGPSSITSGMYAGGQGAYFRDPDGVTVELLERPARSGAST